MILKSILAVLVLSGTTSSNAVSDCYWVVQIWREMGQTTTVDESSVLECCSMRGVTCVGEGNVTAISWTGRQLSGNIPNEFGN